MGQKIGVDIKSAVWRFLLQMFDNTVLEANVQFIAYFVNQIKLGNVIVSIFMSD